MDDRAITRTPPAAARTRTAPDADVLRRVLLGLVTVLIVARPLVPGDDPARNLPWSGIANQVLTFGWLLAAFGWAVWRFGSGRGEWKASGVEAGLLLALILVFISADQARYQYGAWLAAGEWVALLLAFCLVRQLIRTRRENARLLAALAATAVCLAAQAAIERFVPGPERRLDPTVAEIFGFNAENPEVVSNETLTNLLQGKSSALAGLLVLATPVLLGGYLLVMAAPGRRNRLVWEAVCCALVLYGLLVAGFPGGVTALVVVAAGFFVVQGVRNRWERPQWAVAAGLFLVAGALAWLSDGLGQVLPKRLEGAAATRGMIADHFWLGVGPGQFDRYYPRHLTSPAAEKVLDPHNFILEITATGGIFLLAVVMATGVLFFQQVRIGLTETPEDVVEPAGRGPGWEFYLGGMIGLAIGFVLRVSDLPYSNLPGELALAAVRMAAWFVAFLLLERIPWTYRSQAVAVSLGVAAVLVFLTLSSGFGNPALMQAMLVAMALALNAVPGPSVEWSKWGGLIVPMPVLALAVVAFLFFILLPTITSATAAAQARRAYPHWRAEMERQLEQPGQSPQAQVEAARRMNRYLTQNILAPLEEATTSEQAEKRNRFLNVNLLAERSYWHARQWRLIAALPPETNPNRQTQLAFGMSAAAAATEACQLDPEGRPGYWSAFAVRQIFAAEGPETERPNQFRLAADALRSLVDRDPTEPGLRYLLAIALAEANAATEARPHAEEALRLTNVPGARRPLDDFQQAQLKLLLKR